ncbi:phosphatidylinositol 4,5-bisphosphate-binding protein [Pleosporales sp. CAS-2024a]
MAGYHASDALPSPVAAVPGVDDASHLGRGYGASSALSLGGHDFGHAAYASSMPDERRGRFEESFDAPTRGHSVLDGELPQRSASRGSTTLHQGSAPSRTGTLKKKASLKRSGGRRSMHAGSIRGVAIDGHEGAYDRQDSVFYTPVPTKGSPTDVLAERFQTWRRFLKDLITYFREISASYEQRAKSLLKISNVINNTNAPTALLVDGGINDANRILRDFHKQALVEANQARDIEADVITQLSGLRADLAQKIKEIKSLSGDFKNNVDKEKETTRKCVAALEEALALVDSDPTALAGKGDPYVVRLAVDRQVERQIDEENYLHRAYLNLENSGRELESIVVGEIQKAYNALATILKRDADDMYATVERLRAGPIAMPRDHEWTRFVKSDPHFVNPDIPLRRLEDIEYPGRHHPATAEVRAGMLERKSKYLKSYTPGWYVLSPTHLHEFKSADRIYTQPPVMSLYLPDQKLGSRSQPGSSSHKFVIKGRQTGSMHRGHTWVFRAESYDTMLAWFDCIKALTEKSGEERNAFVRRHASVRSTSAGSAHSASSDGGLEEDEADAVPYSANVSLANQPIRQGPTRPSGGRFPSDLNVNRNLQAPLSPSSGSSDVGHELGTAAGGSAQDYDSTYPTHPTDYHQAQPVQSIPVRPVQQPFQSITVHPDMYSPFPQAHAASPAPIERHESDYGDWMAPAAAGGAVGGAAIAALAHEAHQRKHMAHQHEMAQRELAEQEELDKQAEQERLEERVESLNYDPRYPVAQFPPPTSSAVGPAPVIPERDPDHHAPLASTDVKEAGIHPTLIPAPVMAAGTSGEATDSHLDNTLSSRSTTTSFLDDSEIGAAVAASGNTINGGPVPQEVVDVADAQAHPGMHRTNTDISVSDLHVPGEYPKAADGGANIPAPVTEESVMHK